MEIIGRKAFALQSFGEVFGPQATAGVDDGATRILAEQSDRLFAFVFGVRHAIGQVGASEALLQQPFLPEAQFRLDVVGHLRRGGGGQRQDWGLGKLGSYLGDSQVGGAEIVAPLRDAVRLVHHDQAESHLRQIGSE